MANIRLDLQIPIEDGQTLTFKSPADCSQITGLIIYYPVDNTTTSKAFKFVDAHGVDVGSSTISLFAENVLVKVILDTDSGKAFVQNADTNAYLEGKLAEKYSPDNKPSPSDIGAAATSHNQAASTITAGTFAGQVAASASGQSPSVSCLRNSKFSFDESDVPTVEGETVWYLK